MHPSDSVRRVIGGKRYDVRTATEIASDEYWDGNNFEHGGRNQFLFRTPRGAYFAVHMSQWQGEPYWSIEPIDEAQAMQLYDQLQEHGVSWDSAFPDHPAVDA